MSGEREKKRFTRLRRLYADTGGRGKAYYMNAAVIFALNIYAKEVINFFFRFGLLRGFSFFLFIMHL